MPQIDVIVPVYRVEKYINRCVKSILNQTFQDFLLTLIDDGSDDLSAEIIDEYALQYDNAIIVHTQNGGQSRARNIGLDLSDLHTMIEWLAFVDSDDWLDLSYLEQLYNNCMFYDVDVSICEGINEFENNGNCLLENLSTSKTAITEIIEMKDIYSLNIDFPALAPHNPWGKLIRRQLFFNLRFPLGKMCEDRFTMYKAMFLTDKFVYVKLPLYRYFINYDGLTRTRWRPRRMDEVESCEQQMAYFGANGFNKAYYCMIADYLNVIFVNMWEILQLDGLYQEEYEYLKDKLKKALKSYRRVLGIGCFSKYDYYAYPIKMKLYEHIKSMLKKVKNSYEKNTNCK